MTKNFTLLLSTWVAISLLSGCDRNTGTPATETGNAHAAAPEEVAAPPEASGEPAAVAQAGAPAPDRYPLLNFGLLDVDERVRFLSIAEAELCPCDGTASSLDACLQAEDVCMLAVTTAEIGMRMIKESAGDLEISDAMTQHVANARRVHTFDLSNTPWKGAEGATVTVVEFADFECPHCAELANVVRQLAERYGDRVRFYYKSFPLESHRNALAASLASHAAHRQGYFWQMHDLIFTHQRELQNATDANALLLSWAEQIGMNLERFQTDMADPAILAIVNAERQEGLTAGLSATPTLFINGVMVQDGYDVEGLSAQLDRALAAAAP
jgi:protein-disulfide isomerase